jgi:predicted enzyme related to lactoylglutathione lyase
MDKNIFGVIIKVENLEISRAFYRDILELGNPVMDSNFWVEFRLPGNFSLFLEKKEDDEKIPESQGRLSWVYRVKNVKEILERLKKYGYEAIAEKEMRLGCKIHLFCDPEGNPFHIYPEEK